MAMRRPFLEFNFQEIEQKVGVMGLRPDLTCLYDTTPDQIIYLIEKCWNKDLSKRPNFTSIYNQLEQEVSSRCGDDQKDLVENRKQRYLKQKSSLDLSFSFKNMSLSKSIFGTDTTSIAECSEEEGVSPEMKKRAMAIQSIEEDE